MAPRLVSAPAARAYDGVGIEATAGAALAGAIRLGRWKDEAAFSARELCLVARHGLSNRMDGGLSVAMEHQESTGGGGRSVVGVWVMGGSWKADREGLWVYGKKDSVYGMERQSRRSQELKARKLAGAKLS
jgi:hypothetical protein